jgi:hypothetical protein
VLLYHKAGRTHALRLGFVVVLLYNSKATLVLDMTTQLVACSLQVSAARAEYATLGLMCACPLVTQSCGTCSLPGFMILL